MKQVKSNQRDKKDKTLKIELSGIESPNPESTSPILPQSTSFEEVSATPYKDRAKSFTQNSDCLHAPAKTDFLLPLGKSNSPSQSISSSSDVELSPDPENRNRPLKKRRVDSVIFQKREPLYPFFGPERPITKLIALSCLEYLDGPSLYAMSCVNRIWCQAVMDDALWE